MDQLECWFTAIISFHLVVISTSVDYNKRLLSRSSPSKSPQITTLAAILHFLLNNSAACGVVKIVYRTGSRWSRLKAPATICSDHNDSKRGIPKMQLERTRCFLRQVPSWFEKLSVEGFYGAAKFYVANKFKLFFLLCSLSRFQFQCCDGLAHVACHFRKDAVKCETR